MPAIVHSLARFLSTRVLTQLADYPRVPLGPSTDTESVATLVADVSGFTARTEALLAQGRDGVERAKSDLDGFFGTLVDQVHRHGGDVLKFAGDGLLAAWEGHEALGGPSAAIQRAAACAIEARKLLKQRPTTGVDVRMMLGWGQLRVEVLGGPLDRWELAVGGDALTQLEAIDALPRPDEIVLTSAARQAVGPGLTGEPIGEGHLRLLGLDGWPGIPRRDRRVRPEQEAGMRAFIPRAVQSAIGSGYEEWTAELRRVTAVFVHLPDLDGSVWDQVAIRALQEQLYRYEGSLNKLGPDPQGVMALAAFGLPPLSHEEDALRGVRAACAIHRELVAQGRPCSIGVATGKVFCGLIGTEERCEYTLIGDAVNLAARLAKAADDRVLVEHKTVRACLGRARFQELPPIRVKGKRDPVAVYRPS